MNLFFEEDLLEQELLDVNLDKDWRFIPSSNKIKLSGFDCVLTCNGSIRYECHYLRVAVVSCSRRFSEHLNSVFLARDETSLLKTFDRIDDAFNADKFVVYDILYNWIFGRSFRELHCDDEKPIENYSKLLLALLENVKVDKCYVSYVKNSKEVVLLDAI